MDIAVRRYQETHIIDLKGDLDLYSAFRLKDTVQKMLAMGIRVFILNLKGVHYVDSSGIGALLSINHLLAKDGRKFRIAALTQPVQNLLGLTRLTGVFPISKTVLEAVETIDSVAESPKQDPA